MDSLGLFYPLTSFVDMYIHYHTKSDLEPLKWPWPVTVKLYCKDKNINTLSYKVLCKLSTNRCIVLVIVFAPWQLFLFNMALTLNYWPWTSTDWLVKHTPRSFTIVYNLDYYRLSGNTIDMEGMFYVSRR